LEEHFKAGRLFSVVKLLMGLAVLCGLLIASSKGIIPSDNIGGVISHNLAEKIDATPLFYSECEDMPRLEAGISDCPKIDE